MASELDGFVIYRNEKGNKTAPHACALLVSKFLLTLSMKACQELEDPAYVHVFFDERRRRLMIVKAEPDAPNSFLLARQGNKAGDRRCALSSKYVRENVEKLAGFSFDGLRFLIHGHKAPSSQPALIFELADLRKEVFG